MLLVRVETMQCRAGGGPVAVSGEGEVWGDEGLCSNTPSYFTAHSPPQTASVGIQVQQEARYMKICLNGYIFYC